MRRSSASRSRGAASFSFFPKRRTSPERGRSSPMRQRSSEDFPQPLPPMMMKISPAETEKFRFRMIAGSFP